MAQKVVKVSPEELVEETHTWLSGELMIAQLDDVQNHFPRPHGKIWELQFTADSLREILDRQVRITDISDEEISAVIDKLIQSGNVKVSDCEGAFLYHD